MIDPSRHPRPTTAIQPADADDPAERMALPLPTGMTTGDHPIIAEVQP